MLGASGGQDGHDPLPPGIVARLIRTWRSPARVMRAQASLSEGGLMMVLFLAMALTFLAQLPMHRRMAILDPSIPSEGWAFGTLVGLILAALLAYVLAALVALILRRRISGHASRVALFWSVLAVSPLMLLAGLGEGYLGAGPPITALRYFAFAAFMWFWICGIRTLWEKR